MQSMLVIFPLQVHFDAQWLIQNFADEGTSPRGGVDLLFGIIFGKNCMRMKKVGLGGGHVSLAFLDLPLMSEVIECVHLI